MAPKWNLSKVRFSTKMESQQDPILHKDKILARSGSPQRCILSKGPILQKDRILARSGSPHRWNPSKIRFFLKMESQQGPDLHKDEILAWSISPQRWNLAKNVAPFYLYLSFLSFFYNYCQIVNEAKFYFVNLFRYITCVMLILSTSVFSYGRTFRFTNCFKIYILKIILII